MKFLSKALLLTIAASLHCNILHAATLSAVLDEQNLAVLTLEDDEALVQGEQFVLESADSSCTMEVISIKDSQAGVAPIRWTG